MPIIRDKKVEIVVFVTGVILQHACITARNARAKCVLDTARNTKKL